MRLAEAEVLRRRALRAGLKPESFQGFGAENSVFTL
jgi:hypothetical protein